MSECQVDVGEKLVSSSTMKSTSDDEIGTENSESGFTTVKFNKFQQNVKSNQIVFETYNLFEEFNQPGFQDQETITMEHDLNETSDLPTNDQQDSK